MCVNTSTALKIILNVCYSNGNCENGESMDVDAKLKDEDEEEEENSKPGSLLSNPGKLESIIKFGRSLQELAQKVPPPPPLHLTSYH